MKNHIWLLIISLFIIEKITAQSITIDYAKEIAVGSPLIFGGCKSPNQIHSADVFPRLKEAGITIIRNDVYFETVLPENITLEDYKNNVNDVQNPDNWNWNQLWWVHGAKAQGMKVMLIFIFSPYWLGQDGRNFGAPKDMDVWKDIVAKVFNRYKDKVDYCEIWNEPHVTMQKSWDTAKYKTKEDAVSDLYYYAVDGIRKVSKEVVIGGMSWHHLKDHLHLLKDPRFDKKKLQFISFHPYEDQRGDLSQWTFEEDFRAIEPYGYTMKDVFLTEWNQNIDGFSDVPEKYTGRGICWAGKTLMHWMELGVGGAMYFALFPLMQHGDGFHLVRDNRRSTTQGFYRWRANKKEGYLIHQAKAFRLSSVALGLGKGEYSVKSTLADTNKISKAVGAVNTEGVPVAMLVNHTRDDKTIEVFFKNIPFNGKAQLKIYLATEENEAKEPVSVQNVVVKNGELKFVVPMTEYSMAGVRVEKM
jgi:hypothetical protein